MGALKTEHSPELKGLYANSNRLTQPKGTVPRLCNLYLVRRGEFHTVPGTQWISSWDGLAPHVATQQPIIFLKWYAPSAGSSPDLYMSSVAAPNVTAHNFLVALQLATGPTGVILQDVSVGAFLSLAAQAGAVSPVSNMAQMLDYLIVALGNTVPPMIFPAVTAVALPIG